MAAVSFSPGASPFLLVVVWGMVCVTQSNLEDEWALETVELGGRVTPHPPVPWLTSTSSCPTWEAQDEVAGSLCLPSNTL